VDGRVHEAEGDDVSARALRMQSSDENEHLHNDPFAAGKFDSPVYKPPSYRRRVEQWIETVRSVTHQ
jgi:hypothetical protein